MKEPVWDETHNRAVGRYGRWKMIRVHEDEGRFFWSVSWSGGHMPLLKGESTTFEEGKTESVNALGNFIKKTFGI
jgi:hypothetical protein